MFFPQNFFKMYDFFNQISRLAIKIFVHLPIENNFFTNYHFLPFCRTYLMYLCGFQKIRVQHALLQNIALQKWNKILFPIRILSCSFFFDISMFTVLSQRVEFCFLRRLCSQIINILMECIDP